ncbi:ribonuclease P protein component [bacterium]|nr:ribonuclease P protein component [bacterium]
MLDLHFRKEFKIRKKTEFQAIFSDRRRAFGKYLFLYYKFNEEFPKIGFIVSKKKRNGVQRNKLRRQIKEVFRLHQHDIKNVSLTVGVKNGVKSLEYSLIEQDFLNILKREQCLYS